MSLVFHIEQLILSKNKKAKLYDGDFPYQNKQTGEIIQVHRKFYALNLAHAEKLSQHIKKLEHYKLERGNWKHAFGISHDQSTGKVLRFAQRISGTRNLKTNFNKGLNAGGIPLFAFTRHSYAMVLSTIKGNKSDISPEMAIRLAAVIGSSERVWMGMQDTYDLWHARQKIDTSKLQRLCPA